MPGPGQQADLSRLEPKQNQKIQKAPYQASKAKAQPQKNAKLKSHPHSKSKSGKALGTCDVVTFYAPAPPKAFLPTGDQLSQSNLSLSDWKTPSVVFRCLLLTVPCEVLPGEILPETRLLLVASYTWHICTPPPHVSNSYCCGKSKLNWLLAIRHAF